MHIFSSKLRAAMLGLSLSFSTLLSPAAFPDILVVSAQETAWPVTVTDQLGREVTITEEPQTLVSGYYISTSLLVTLGLTDRLVGIEAKADSRPIYSLAAPKLLELPSVGTAKEFDLEGCAALNPDLVVVPAKLKDQIPAMEELGLTVLAVRPEDEAALLDAVNLLADATGTQEKAEALNTYYTEQVESLTKTLADCDTPSVYLAGVGSILRVAGSGMYQNTLIERSGGTNIAAELTDSSWVDISYEQLLSWNPDVILLAAEAEYTVEDVLNDETLSSLTAVADGAVYQIPSAFEAWDSPVPGCILGSLWSASILHPELFAPETFQAEVIDFYETFYGFTPDLNSLP